LGYAAACGSNSTGFTDEFNSPDASSDDSSTQFDGYTTFDSTGVDTNVSDTSFVYPDTLGDELPPPIDASLDIPFPDGFNSPDYHAPDSSLLYPDASVAEGGCANGVTCNGTVAVTCSSGSVTQVDCASSSKQCAPGYGCVSCIPGSGSCNGSTGTVCLPDGGAEVSHCDPELGLTCNGGVCEGACAPALIGQSYIGCEYFAVTMSNTELDQNTFKFWISVANAGTNTATLTITGGGLGAALTQTVAAGSIGQFQLPWVQGLSIGTGTFPANIPSTSLVTSGGYHIKSTEPIVVYQYNSRDYQLNVLCTSDPNGSPPCHAYTDDSSLLLPVNAMTGNYRVAAWPTWHSIGCQKFNPLLGCIQFSCSATNLSYQSPGNLVVVATQDGTSVTVNTTGAIQTGASLGTNGGTVIMNTGDVLQLASALDATNSCTYGSDLSGSLVTATKPVEVFGGHDCTFIPANQFACDHLEQVMFPIETLRNDYLVTVPYNDFAPAGTAGKMYVKIVGTAANTALTFSPASVHAVATIGAGQVLTFEANQNFEVTSGASGPAFLVTMYMESQNSFTTSQAATTAGDPSETTAVATAQFRTSYNFVAPPNWQENWVNVIAKTGSSVTIDGTVHGPSAFNSIGTSGYGVAIVSLCANNAGGCTGVHTASSTSPFGIQVYGYGIYTSYWYPGGLDLRRQ
jgi:hypothetical protein